MQGEDNFFTDQNSAFFVQKEQMKANFLHLFFLYYVFHKILLQSWISSTYS